MRDGRNGVPGEKRLTNVVQEFVPDIWPKLAVQISHYLAGIAHKVFVTRYGINLCDTDWIVRAIGLVKIDDNWLLFFISIEKNQWEKHGTFCSFGSQGMVDILGLLSVLHSQTAHYIFWSVRSMKWGRPFWIQMPEGIIQHHFFYYSHLSA